MSYPVRKNVLADSLSRGKFTKFWEEAPHDMNKEPEESPDELWPVSKIWKTHKKQALKERRKPKVKKDKPKNEAVNWYNLINGRRVIELSHTSG